MMIKHVLANGKEVKTIEGKKIKPNEVIKKIVVKEANNELQGK